MLIRGDARAIPFADTCVHTCVTSPPYYQQRDYGDARQIGLEQHPEAYVAELVTVFREVRRVLRDDGTCWIVVGSSYAARGRGGGGSFMAERSEASWHHRSTLNGWRSAPDGFKAKDLIPIPWLVGLALQQDGWWLRGEIIWAKPNCMPSSVEDRPTMSHETILLLSKSRTYYYDAAAIAEPVSLAMEQQVEQGYDGLGLKDYDTAGVQNPSSVKSRIIANARDRCDRKRKEVERDCQQHRENRKPNEAYLTRNKRSVWTVATQPTTLKHFASFPENLVAPCILAGCPLGGLVLDPFIGSGTVGVVAERLGRRWVGIDLAYQDLAADRTRQRGLLVYSADGLATSSSFGIS